MIKSTAALLGIVLLIIIVSSAIFALSAIVLMLGWGWFMVPVLGFALLSFGEAFGLAVLTSGLGTLFVGTSLINRKKN